MTNATHRSFTLVEVIAAMTIISIIGLLSTFVLTEAVDGYADASTRGELHLELSVAMDQVTRELRSIPLDAAAASLAPDISNVDLTSIDFGATGSLQLTGNDLVLARPGETPATIMAGVTDLTITAFDESNANLALPRTGTACDPIRRLSISITAAQAGITETLRTKLFIRSMSLETGP
jgi:prepilin-type N-terminal cleavage/methylation domain-containing protein